MLRVCTVLIFALALQILYVHGGNIPEKKDKCVGKTRIWNTCGSACPTTCANHGKNVMCTMQCVEGCFCRSPYILQSSTSRTCILPEECPKIKQG